MPIPSRAAEARLEALFPTVTPEPPRGTFEVGLVLGGTVSAGAYTAGALDFLLQALEAWGESSPPHRVMIKMAGGASGGAVCASILGVLSDRVVPHVEAEQAALVADAAATGNPLWDIWVNDFEATKLLSTGDIDANQDADLGTGVTPGPPPKGDGTPVQHVPSLLNCQMIDDAAQTLIALAQAPGATPRGYFGAPFRVVMTLSNVRGIPFTIKGVPAEGAFTGAAYVQRDDFVWFAFPNGASQSEKREDEFWLSASTGSNVVGYDTLANYAIASGSMPMGLVARTLVRPAEHYLYRPFVRPQEQPPGYEITWINPDWTELPDTSASGNYQFTAVDGGCFNNDPVRLVHRALAGLVGANPRSPSNATRALLMIDPLADQPAAIPPSGRSLLRVASAVVGLFVNGARYLTADIDLFRDEDVFSRFQMVPARPEPGRVGQRALAGTSFGALAGWCARAYRVHDYLLGRANMQAYLRSEFVLAGDNPLFDGWSLGLRADYAMDEKGARVGIDASTPHGSYFLPILPDKTGVIAAMPAWPVAALDPQTLVKPIENRLEAVFKKLRVDNLEGFVDTAVAALVVPEASKLLAAWLVNDLKSGLQQAQLLDGASGEAVA